MHKKDIVKLKYKSLKFQTVIFEKFVFVKKNKCGKTKLSAAMPKIEIF